MRSRNLAETEQLIIYTLDNTAAAADPVRNPLGQFLCLFDLSGALLGAFSASLTCANAGCQQETMGGNCNVAVRASLLLFPASSRYGEHSITN